MDIKLKKGSKIAIESNQGYYLLELKEDLKQYRIRDIFNSDLFESIQILKGIEIHNPPYKKVDLYFKSFFNLKDIQINYQKFDFQDRIKAILFNPRERESIDFQKNLLLCTLNNIEDDLIKILPMENIRKIAKLLKPC